MQHLEVSGAVRHIYIYIYVVRRLKVNRQSGLSPVTLGTVSQITQVTCHRAGYISVSMSSYKRGHSSRPTAGHTQGSSDLGLFLLAPHFAASA